jgi:hypothetical protein
MPWQQGGLARLLDPRDPKPDWNPKDFKVE